MKKETDIVKNLEQLSIADLNVVVKDLYDHLTYYGNHLMPTKENSEILKELRKKYEMSNKMLRYKINEIFK